MSAKVVFLGPTGVGKTCLVDRVNCGCFEPRAASSIAPSFRAKHCLLDSGERIELNLWDTAGQERFQSLTTLYYRDAQIAVVCHDADLSGVPVWAKRARDATPNCVVFMVLTKADLYPREEIPALEARARAMGQPFDARHCTTSAKTGEGVEDLIRALANAASEVFVAVVETPGSAVVALEEDQSAENGCC